MSLFSRLFSRGAQKAYHRGMESYNQGDFEGAIASLEGVLESAARSSPIYVLSRFYVTHARVHLGLSYIERERYDDAHAMFLDVVKRNPDYPDVHFHLGRIAERRSLWREAEMRYKRSLLINADYREPRLALGLLYRSLERHEDAVEHMERLADSGLALPASWLSGDPGGDDEEVIAALQAEVTTPRGNTELIAVGLEHYQAGRLEEALEAFTRAVESAPGHPDLRCRRATVLAELERFDEAVEDLSAALERNPGYQEARLKRGVALYQSRNYLDAASDFQYLTKADASNQETRLLLGMSLYKASRIGDAIDHLTQAASSKGVAGRAHYFLALCYVAIERRDRAISVLEPIALPTCRALLGRLYLETNRGEEAVTALEEAIAGGLDAPDVKSALARAFYEAGRADEAKRHATEGLADERTAAASALLLARLAFDAGDDEVALGHLGQDRPTEDFHVLVMRGRVLGRLERYADAEAALQRALELRPDAEEAKRALGLVWRRAGKPEASEGLLEGATNDPIDALYESDEPPPELKTPWKMIG